MKTKVTLDDIHIEHDNREYSDEGAILYAELNGAAPGKTCGAAHIPELRGTLRIRFSATVTPGTTSWTRA